MPAIGLRTLDVDAEVRVEVLGVAAVAAVDAPRVVVPHRGGAVGEQEDTRKRESVMRDGQVFWRGTQRNEAL